MKKVSSICFVCLGNIVRSPLAEHLFRHHARKRGLEGRFEVRSAGTSDYHIGEPPDYRMRLVAKEHGLDYDGRAQQIRFEDLQRYDLLLAMDREVFEHLKQMAANERQREKLLLLRAFDPEADGKLDVPDPYYDIGRDGFEEVYQIIERSVVGLLDHLERDNGLIASQ